MNKRWDTPETVVSLYRIDNKGEEHEHQDCVVGIELYERGMLRLDLRELRPIRVLDRNNLVIDIYLHDVLEAIADKMRATVKE